MKITKKNLGALVVLMAGLAGGDVHADVPFSAQSTASNVALAASGMGNLAGEAPIITQSSSSSIAPNDYGKSLTTPVAWGAAYGTIYAGAAVSNRAPYKHGTAFSTSVGDGAVAVGIGIGNPIDNFGLQTNLTQYSVHSFNNWGMSFQLNHYLSTSQAVAVGVSEVMLSTGGDTGRSYYVVYSQAVPGDAFVDNTTGTSRLHYSIGAGTGYFSAKTQADIFAGKGERGTYVFGNVAYELFHQFNLITDWNGVNLNVGVSKTFLLTKSIPIVLTVGAVDLTGYSGDGVRYIIGVGTGIAL